MNNHPQIRVLAVFSILLLAMLAAVPRALAQGTAASLSILVQDPSQAVIPGAAVTISSTDTGLHLTLKTNHDGLVVFPSLQPIRYTLSIQKRGFAETVVDTFKLDVAAAKSLVVILKVGKANEVITVNAENALNTTDGTVSTVISHEFIENMPLNGDDLTTLFELTPGTLLNAGGTPENGGGFSVDGQRPTSNYLTIDGASGEAYISSNTVSSLSNNTGAGIATSASGGTNGILPIDAIEEYRMDTSTYTAENGRSPGGQIQVRTRGGTNQFHGTLFEDFRNQILDADDWFTNYDNLKQTPLRMNEFGGTLGGPILKNKFFFFVANDNLVFDQPETLTNSYVPDASVLQGAYSPFSTWLTVFPSGNGGQVPSDPSFDYFSESYPDLIRDHAISVRLDGQLPRSIHAFFRTNIAPSSATEASAPISGSGSRDRVDTYTGGFTIPLNVSMVDDLTVNYTSNNANFVNSILSIGGNSPNALQNNLPTGVNASFETFAFDPQATNTSVGYANSEVGAALLNGLHQWNVVDKLSLQRGRNTIKFGIDFLARQSILESARQQFTIYENTGNAAPYTNSDIDTGLLSSLSIYTYSGYPTISLSNTSLFVNDDWKATSSVTFNVGIRWELNPAPTVGPLGTLAFVGDNTNPATFQDALSTKPLYQTVYNNFAPRFGFAWVPRQNTGTVIRGGAGIYFDTGQAAATAGTTGSSAYPYVSTQTLSEVPYASFNWASPGNGNSLGNIAASPVTLVDPHLLSPRTYEWSLTIDQSFGKYTKLTTSYVGNDGEKLVGQDEFYNGENSAGQYPVNTTYLEPNGTLYIVTNQSHSNYQAIQAQLTSQIGKRLSALVSYTWSHAEDDGSSDFSSVGAAAPNPIANSANDVPQIFATAIHYAPEGFKRNRILQALTDGWGLDTIARLQSALPLTVTYSNINDDNTNQYITNADVVPGLPTVLHEHLDSYGKVVPGNRLLNSAAFTAPPTNSSGVQLRNGDSSTNGYRLFGLKQWDLAASRTWKIWKELNLNFRVDAFNLLNTANFADVNTDWSSSDASSFGRSAATYANTYGGSVGRNGASGAQLSEFENGGPRELQLSMKLKF